MKISTEVSHDPRIAGSNGARAAKTTGSRAGAFTLIEVMIVMALMTILFVSAFGAITSMSVVSRRAADAVAGMELAEAKIHDIRATNYPGTNGIFSATTTTTNINSVSVDLNKAGTTLAVPGTIISTIAPIAWGHLVTVQVIIRESNLSLTNTLQTVVNSYSGGRGQ